MNQFTGKSNEQIIADLILENKELKQYIENLKAPHVGECFKLPDNPYVYKLCEVGLEGHTFYVLYCKATGNTYTGLKKTIKEAFGVSSYNYDFRIKQDDNRSQSKITYPVIG